MDPIPWLPVASVPEVPLPLDVPGWVVLAPVPLLLDPEEDPAPYELPPPDPGVVAGAGVVVEEDDVCENATGAIRGNMAHTLKAINFFMKCS